MASFFQFRGLASNAIEGENVGFANANSESNSGDST